MWNVEHDGPAPTDVEAIDSVGRIKPPGKAIFRMPASAEETPTPSQSGGTCSFADMLPLFTDLLGVDASHVPAICGRIKFLLKHRACGGAGSGRGNRRSYTAADVWELLVELELCDIGVSPSKAVGTFRANPQLAYRPDLTGRIVINRRPTSHLFIDAHFLMGFARRHLPGMFA